MPRLLFLFSALFLEPRTHLHFTDAVPAAADRRLMKLSEILYKEVSPIWESYLTHPFIQELRDGTLPVEKFRFYMIQDYRYLYDYCKVFALGIVKAGDPDLMRFFSDFVHFTLNGEMTIHRAYLKRLGASREEILSTPMSLANVSYTHYMLEKAYTGGVLEIMVSILACAWSYELIGQDLVKNNPQTLQDPFFGEWVQGYSSDKYAQETRQLIDMTDRLGEGITPARLEDLKEIFVNCSRYEYAFWDMAYGMEK